MKNNRLKNKSKELIRGIAAELKENISDKTFCILPFIHLSLSTNGNIKLCCRSKSVANINKVSMEDFWFSEKMNKIRKDVLRGEKIKECKACWDLENNNIVSLREGQNIQRGVAYREYVGFFLKNKKNLKIPVLEIKLSNLCNLKCRMCSPLASCNWIKEWSEVKLFYPPSSLKWVDDFILENKLHENKSIDLYSKNKYFIEDFKKLAPHIKELEFAGGEPLVDPGHYKVLDYIKKYSKNIILKYSTNLTTLGKNNKILDYWKDFKKINLTISIDGPPKINEYIRTGSNAKNIENNIFRVLGELGELVQLKGTTTVSAYNAPYLRETMEYITSLGICWHTSRVNFPDFLDARILPAELLIYSREKLENFNMKTIKNNFNEKSMVSIERHIVDNIKWLKSDTENRKDKFERFISYAKKLDESRNTKLFKVMPVFKKYYEQ